MAKITVQNTNITIMNVDGEDFISITDLARHKSDEPTAVNAFRPASFQTPRIRGV